MGQAGDDDAAPEPDGTDARGQVRRRWVAAAVATVVAAGALVGALALAGGGGHTAAPSDRTTTPPATTAPGAGAPATTAPPGGPSPPATTTPAQAGGGAAPGDHPGFSAPTTALPGVVDHEDPRAVVQAVIDLATAGATPESAAQYLAGGRAAIGTPLFVFLEDGGSTGAVRSCADAGAGARQATCAAHVETAYGTPAEVGFTLARGAGTAPWTVTAIRMPATTGASG